ncbi:MAG: hypothetical protein DRQ40_08555, partial [Gammaproteobacteria bacterium]
RVDLNTMDIPEKAKAALAAIPETTDAQGVTSRWVDTSEVADVIHQARVEQWVGENSEGLDDATKEKFLKAIHTSTANSSKAVFAKGTERRVAKAGVAANINFDNALDKLDANQAMAVANTALASGVWTPETYDKRTKTLSSEIDQKYFGRMMAATKTSDEVDDVLIEMTTGSNNLTATTERSMVSSAMSRRDKLEAQEAKGADTDLYAKTAEAYRAVDNGMTLDQFHQTSHMLEPGDVSKIRSAILSRDSKIRTSPGDRSTIRAYTRRAAALRFPADGQDVSVAGAAILADAQTSMANGTLEYPGYQTIQAAVKEAQDSGFNTPAYKSTKSVINLEVLGTESADDLMFAAMTSNDPAAMTKQAWEKSQVVAKALSDLQVYMSSTGANADPTKWWDTNKHIYSREGLQNTREQNFQQSYGSYSSYTSTGAFDAEATRGNIQQLLSDGALSPREYEAMYRKLFNVEELSAEELSSPENKRMFETHPRLIYD